MKYYVLALLVFSSFLFWSCGGDGPVDVGPRISVSPSTIDLGFSDTEGSFAISNSGTGELSWRARTEEEWIRFTSAYVSADSTETAGNTEGSISFRVCRHILDPGNAVGNIRITSNGGDASIQVSADIPSVLIATPIEIQFGSSRDARTINLQSSYSGIVIDFLASDDADWLTLSPTNGSTPSLISVQPTLAKSEPLSATITITSPDSHIEPIMIPVSVNLAELIVSPDQIEFGESREPIEVQITSSTVNALPWQAGTTAEWLVLDPPSGETGTPLFIAVDSNAIDAKSVLYGVVNIASSVPNVASVALAVSAMPPTYLSFYVTLPSSSWILYLDGDSRGVVRTGEQALRVRVSPEQHIYFFEDEYSGCRSIEHEVIPAATETTNINLSPGDNVSWASCPPSGIVFRGSGLASDMQIYLDGKSRGTLYAPSSELTVECDPGLHTYTLKNLECLLTTESASITVYEYKMTNRYIYDNSLPYITPEVVDVVATKGYYRDRISVKWTSVTPTPTEYEVWRWYDADVGWQLKETVDSSPYVDYNIASFNHYYYCVRANWSCTKSDFSDYDYGYIEDADFYSTQVKFDNVERKVTALTKMDQWGMKGELKRYSFIWYKYYNSSYHYSCSRCTPFSFNCSGSTCDNGVLAIKNYITAPGDYMVWNLSATFPYDCWSDKTGDWLGCFRLYYLSSGTCGDGSYDVSAYVSATWDTSTGEPSVYVLTAEESRRIDDAIRLQGGPYPPISLDDNGRLEDFGCEILSTSTPSIDDLTEDRIRARPPRLSPK